MPKSRILTTSRWPSRSTSMMFSGLRSRWTTPAACACSSAAQDLPDDVQRARAAASARPRSRAVSDSPARNSITRNSEPSAVRPKSVTVMMFGWSRRLADSASRSKRRANSSLPPSSGSSTLMAEIAAHHRVLGAVDGAHAADADPADDPVALADDGADERIGDGRAAARSRRCPPAGPRRRSRRSRPSSARSPMRAASAGAALAGCTTAMTSRLGSRTGVAARATSSAVTRASAAGCWR